MRIHLLSLPNVQSTWAYDLDGFNVMNMRFAKLLKGLGHTVMLYASEENEAPCDELIPITTKAEQAKIIGTDQYQHANISHENPLWQMANPRMAAEIGKRKQPRDVICTIGGGSQQQVTMAHPELMDVEYSIGYVGNYARYRVFQSEAWRHTCYGYQHIECGRFFDAVIPGFFDVDKFPANQPDDYVCYVGRYVPKKGISVVCEAAKIAGVALKLIGHGDASLITYGENLGAIHERDRNEVMSKAKALICPTIYVEPYGCISPEAQLCGTPVISTDFGGFTETVEHGKTGYRCSMLGEFVSAIRMVDGLDRAYIRERARRLYSMEAAAKSYDAYFKRLNTLWTDGWLTAPFELQPVRGLEHQSPGFVRPFTFWTGDGHDFGRPSTAYTECGLNVSDNPTAPTVVEMP